MIVTGYFWWQNTKGMHESSGKALRIMQITTVMVVAFVDLVPVDHYSARPQSTFRPRRFREICNSATNRWAGSKAPFSPTLATVALMIAIGHSLLSMSGFETLAQVYREIAYPKMKN